MADEPPFICPECGADVPEQCLCRAIEPPFVCPYGHRDDEPCLVRAQPDLDWPTEPPPITAPPIGET